MIKHGLVALVLVALSCSTTSSPAETKGFDRPEFNPFPQSPATGYKPPERLSWNKIQRISELCVSEVFPHLAKEETIQLRVESYRGPLPSRIGEQEVVSADLDRTVPNLWLIPTVMGPRKDGSVHYTIVAGCGEVWRTLKVVHSADHWSVQPIKSHHCEVIGPGQSSLWISRL